MSDDLESWLHEEATLDDLRPLARAWLIEQRRATLVTIDPPGQHTRIEALRAASQVVAGALSAGKPLTFGDDGQFEELPARETTIKLAEQFVAWLEG